MPPGSVGYAADARRFLGATFDPSALYRFNAVQRILKQHGLTTAAISAWVTALQEQLIASLGVTAMTDAELLNPLDGRGACALPRFPKSSRAALASRN